MTTRTTTMCAKDAYEITWLIRRLFRAMADKADHYLADDGITAADRAVLEFLYPDARLSVPEIAARYHVSRQHVQVTVNRLVEKGLVETKPNPRHKRSPLIVLTTTGRSLFARVRARDAKIVERLFADIPVAHRRTTHRTLTRLLDALEEGD